jgi:monofunctional glycosyltransferase
MKRFLSLARWPMGAAALVFGCVTYAYITLPDVRSLASSNPKTTAFMELRDAEARAGGKEPRRKHTWVAYRNISPHLKRAVLVAEDAAFWDHDGIDYRELQKSIELDWARGQLVRGASTITQQLAKNLYLSPSRNPLRKLRELIIARRLEAELKKARIFEIYLNVIEWGDGIYGVEAAAHAYFGIPASALGPQDSALLAGAIINPRVLNPAHPTQRLLNRQQIILSRMNVVEPPSEVAADEPETPATSGTVEKPTSEPVDSKPSPDSVDPPKPEALPESAEPPLEPLPAKPLPSVDPTSIVRQSR